MSIMIKGMEMPKTCKECPFSDHEAWYLIPGDWRVEYKCIMTGISYAEWWHVEDLVENAPTFLEEEESE